MAMANTATITATFAYSDPLSSDELIPPDISATIATVGYTRLKQSIATSSTAINLGALSTPTWAIFINRDPTNYIELKVSSSGAIFAKMLPGEWCILRLGSGAQVPYAIANSGACLMEFLICNL